jgi:hypothetical protein
MTPIEYLKIEAEQTTIITAAEDKILAARKKADKCPLPKNLRPATARDIKELAVIWYPDWASRRDGTPGWAVVEEVLHPDDQFKAYCADDGCRYGLDGAFVETKVAA